MGSIVSQDEADDESRRLRYVRPPLSLSRHLTENVSAPLPCHLFRFQHSHASRGWHTRWTNSMSNPNQPTPFRSQSATKPATEFPNAAD